MDKDKAQGTGGSTLTLTGERKLRCVLNHNGPKATTDDKMNSCNQNAGCVSGSILELHSKDNKSL